MHRKFCGWTCVLALVFSAGLHSVQAQELNCRVAIDKRALSESDLDHLDNLKIQIEDYMNNRAWTRDTYQPEERIQCNMTVTFTAANTQGIDRFTARLTIDTQRPIYGSPEASNVFTTIDDNWQFEFDRNQSLFFDLDRYDPLSSLLDYYAFIILGYDYDSFGELAGTPFFEEARKIKDIADTSGGVGWNAISDERSRAAIVRDLLDPRMQPYRQGFYMYHLEGLDLFLIDPNQARENVIGMLEATDEVRDDLPTSLVLDLFFSTKKDEVTALFEDSNLSSRAYGLLLNIDPSNASTYDRLLN